MLRTRIFLCIFGLFSAFALATSAGAQRLPDRVVKAAAKRTTDGRYPSLVIGLVDGDRSAVFAFGKLPDGKPPDGDTVYEIGSVTKTFTATLLARAVRSGHLRLEMPLQEILPEFEIPEAGGGAAGMTLLDVATHYSALPRMPPDLPDADELLPHGNYDIGKLKAFLSRYRLPRAPGTQFEYSNLGYGLLAAGLPRAAGEDYDALLRRTIFRPLGMSLSGAVLSPRIRAHLAPGFDRGKNPSKTWDLGEFDGAGAIRSTAHDLLLYIRANMENDGSPLSDAMQFAQMPRRAAEGPNRVGLAWMNLDTSEGRVVWHNGATFGYSSFLGFMPDRKRGVVVLTNTLADTMDIGFSALRNEAWLAE